MVRDGLTSCLYCICKWISGLVTAQVYIIIIIIIIISHIIILQYYHYYYSYFIVLIHTIYRIALENSSYLIAVGTIYSYYLPATP